MVQQLNTQHQLLKTKLEKVVPELHEAIFDLNQKMKRENQQLNTKITAVESQQDFQMSEYFKIKFHTLKTYSIAMALCWTNIPKYSVNILNYAP